MNWSATVNENVVERPIRNLHLHLFMGEVCEYLGACAIKDFSEVAAFAIELWLESLESEVLVWTRAIESAMFEAAPEYYPEAERHIAENLAGYDRTPGGCCK